MGHRAANLAHETGGVKVRLGSPLDGPHRDMLSSPMPQEWMERGSSHA